MTDHTGRTLFHVFETGVLAWPRIDARILYLNAAPDHVPHALKPVIDAVQGFRSDFLRLKSAGFHVTPEPAGEGYDLALIRLGRHRGQNEAWLREAERRLRPGGPIVVAGTKEEGVDSLRKRVALGGAVDGHLSKYHAVAFWMTAGAGLLPAAETPARVEGRFAAAPGMFSHDRVDAGSRLLAAALPTDLSGRVADFCAGWGYLASVLADRCPAISTLDIYEADHASLEAARTNLDGARPETRFHWIDLVAEPVTGRFDAIVMNPPFHQGRAAEPSLGAALIQTAAKALGRGGRLYLVANRQLPYEATMQKVFATSGEIVRDASFKVLWGRK